MKDGPTGVRVYRYKVDRDGRRLDRWPFPYEQDVEIELRDNQFQECRLVERSIGERWLFQAIEEEIKGLERI